MYASSGLILILTSLLFFAFALTQASPTPIDVGAFGAHSYLNHLSELEWHHALVGSSSGPNGGSIPIPVPKHAGNADANTITNVMRVSELIDSWL
ncbi:hypothetical protein VNI00_013324 [Paramarasmius palmivorus]|uniref:Uncharacterized protein n=1 Tax=Paramarasmius palmivorus TaxID=297713 RepID=A0AAW0BYX3_9AGAR